MVDRRVKTEVINTDDGAVVIEHKDEERPRRRLGDSSQFVPQSHSQILSNRSSQAQNNQYRKQFVEEENYNNGGYVQQQDLKLSYNYEQRHPQRRESAE
eukprot:CAMPEP_0114578152 /NCGR_PEP_ID=MMETSP0125-20121206/2725_1 /TAXON_ID=485358 ORGANISM="Aristerostoma sp., Strain ATCC 50986" /NCGR_SAMPLE_ID=MMETSP0125 /ASSEMBLY_ACC=CAM_ASM_000245 /LENGTH=98 /DNA_ID=CAMNT_0001768003 /DNA_START=1082 /DNA_END=1378 /DNA_ORIENTATION=+